MVRTITGMSGSEQALLRFSSVRLKPVPDRLRFSASMTLRRLDGSVQVISPMPKIRKKAANLALDRPANFALASMFHVVAVGGVCWGGLS